MVFINLLFITTILLCASSVESNTRTGTSPLQQFVAVPYSDFRRIQCEGSRTVVITRSYYSTGDNRCSDDDVDDSLRSACDGQSQCDVGGRVEQAIRKTRQPCHRHYNGTLTVVYSCVDEIAPLLRGLRDSITCPAGRTIDVALAVFSTPWSPLTENCTDSFATLQVSAACRHQSTCRLGIPSQIQDTGALPPWNAPVCRALRTLFVAYRCET